eukprot:365164-Chlamydomonas_euryale.AAC.11
MPEGSGQHVLRLCWDCVLLARAGLMHCGLGCSSTGVASHGVRLCCHGTLRPPACTNKRVSLHAAHMRVAAWRCSCTSEAVAGSCGSGCGGGCGGSSGGRLWRRWLQQRWEVGGLPIRACGMLPVRACGRLCAGALESAE